MSMEYIEPSTPTLNELALEQMELILQTAPGLIPRAIDEIDRTSWESS